MKLALIFALLFALLYGSGLLYLYLFQERIIFRPDLAPKDVTLPKGAKRLFLDGLEVGLLQRGSQTTIFYFGGNANNALEALHLFTELPYNVVTFNYPGYANSKGRPSQKAILSAAQKIFDTFKTQKNILVGRSLGTGVAAFIAAHNHVDGIVLITPYHSITHLARLRYPFYPIHLLLRHPFPQFLWIARTDAPIYVILAEHDTTTPPQTFQKLSPFLKRIEAIVKILGSTHGDILAFEETKKRLMEFIEALAQKGHKD